MPAQVGIDLVDVDAVRAALRDHRDRYLTRVYTAREAADCAGSPNRLAQRFAAKEATIKALRPGRNEAVPWTSIELRQRGARGQELKLSGPALEIARARGLGSFLVSVSSQAGYACAVVCAGPARPGAASS
jgi:holo-[acyl-carrier protein] synthase